MSVGCYCTPRAMSAQDVLVLRTRSAPVPVRVVRTSWHAGDLDAARRHALYQNLAFGMATLDELLGRLRHVKQALVGLFVCAEIAVGR
jgi:hypothetical protein